MCAGRRWRLVVLAVLVVAVLGAAGCAPGDAAVALVQDYRERVERTVDGSPKAAPALDLQAWPRVRERRLELPIRRVDLLEFAALQDCGLGALVGERSSSLGRVMPAPLLLRYTHRFVELAEACRAAAPQEAALFDALLRDKNADLAAIGWNATIASRALAANHSLAVDALTPGRVRGAGARSSQALRGLAQRLAPASAELSEQAWLEPWQQLDGDRFAGRLLQSLALLAAELGGVNRVLEAQRVGARGTRLCPEGRPSPAATILNTVFLQRYAADVQGYLAAVEAEAARWNDAMDALVAAQVTAVPSGLEVTPVARAAARLATVRARHTQLWQQTLTACGLQPTGVSAGR